MRKTATFEPWPFTFLFYIQRGENLDNGDAGALHDGDSEAGALMTIRDDSASPT